MGSASRRRGGRTRRSSKCWARRLGSTGGDGVAVSGCLYLATLAEGAEVETVERSATLDEVQEAFIERAAFQCGFCTPGFVLMTRQLLAENPDPSEDEIGHYLSGNLCRCATYPEIIEAVKLTAKKRTQSLSAC